MSVPSVDNRPGPSVNRLLLRRRRYQTRREEESVQKDILDEPVWLLVRVLVFHDYTVHRSRVEDIEDLALPNCMKSVTADLYHSSEATYTVRAVEPHDRAVLVDQVVIEGHTLSIEHLRQIAYRGERV